MAELKTIITLRQGTTAEWADSEVVLKTGEMGLEYLSDGNVKIKAGDSEHLWSALPYIGSDVDAVQGTVEDLIDSLGTPSTENSEATGLYKEVEDIQEEVKELADIVGNSNDALDENVQTIWAHVNNHTARIETLEAIDHSLLATKGEVAAEAKLREDADKILQNQINLIMDNPDTENIIDSINEFTKYIEEHGSIANGFRQDIDNNAKAIADEITRAEKVEVDHEKRIADMETFWDVADDPEGAIDKLAEIINYIEVDKSGALDMAADIQANRNAISAIYAPASEGVEASGVLVTEIARIENKADANALAIEAINNIDNGILAQANAYTDTAITGLPAATADVLGLVKFDNSTIKMNESKQLYVAKVSTDVLEQGSQTLILNGGSATE